MNTGDGGNTERTASADTCGDVGLNPTGVAFDIMKRKLNSKAVTAPAVDPPQLIRLEHEGKPRPLGAYAGQIIVAEDFDAPLPEWDEALDQAL